MSDGVLMEDPTLLGQAIHAPPGKIVLPERIKTEREKFIDDVRNWQTFLEFDGDPTNAPPFMTQELWNQLPTPLYWRLLIMPMPAQDVSKGGIILAGDALTAQQYNTHVGVILAIGNDAWTDERFTSRINPSIGTWVLLSRYAGHRFEFAEKGLILANESELIATLGDPSLIKCYL